MKKGLCRIFAVSWSEEKSRTNKVLHLRALAEVAAASSTSESTVLVCTPRLSHTVYPFFSRLPYFRGIHGLTSVRENNMTAKSANTVV